MLPPKKSESRESPTSSRPCRRVSAALSTSLCAITPIFALKAREMDFAAVLSCIPRTTRRPQANRHGEPSRKQAARLVKSNCSPPRYNLPVNLDDTIVAIATPPGRGGIGVVRLAGPEARAIALPMLRLKHDLEPGRAVFGELVEPGSAGVGTGLRPVQAEQGSAVLSRIDEIVVTYFA